MVSLVEALRPELDKKAFQLYVPRLDAIVDGIIKNSAIAQEESEDLARFRAAVFHSSDSDR